VPDAIAFLREYDVRARCVALAREARAELCALFGTQPLAPDDQILQMASVRIPEPDPSLSKRLFDEHRIEIPTVGAQRGELLRISIAPYTTREDVERLLDVLPAALRTSRSPA
jgi:selenocysteine lyase/cysteine desulfurase